MCKAPPKALGIRTVNKTDKNPHPQMNNGTGVVHNYGKNRYQSYVNFCSLREQGQQVPLPRGGEVVLAELVGGGPHLRGTRPSPDRPQLDLLLF